MRTFRLDPMFDPLRAIRVSKNSAKKSRNNFTTDCTDDTDWGAHAPSPAGFTALAETNFVLNHESTSAVARRIYSFFTKRQREQDQKNLRCVRVLLFEILSVTSVPSETEGVGLGLH